MPQRFRGGFTVESRRKLLQICNKAAQKCEAALTLNIGKFGLFSGDAELQQLFYFCSSSPYFLRFLTKVALSIPRLAAAARTLPYRA